MDNVAQPTGTAKDLVWNYDTSSTTHVVPITDIWSSFLDESDCGTVTCDLVRTGTTNAYNSNSDNEVTMDGTTFAITIKKNVAAGYATRSWRVRCRSMSPTS